MAATTWIHNKPVVRIGRPRGGTLVVAALIIAFGFYIGGPVVLIFINSFNLAQVGQPLTPKG